MLVDYHAHTAFSNDCNVPMRTQCEAAVRAGMRQIAFTEHEENNPKEYLPFSFDHPAYFKELARCRAHYGAQLTIRAAIEISEPHRYAAATQRVLSAHPWDFVLGSLHWLDADTNTNSREFFTRDGEGSWRAAFRRYFREMLTLAQRGDFDILAHLDYPARYASPYSGAAYDIAEYEPEIRAVLRAVIARDKGIEINTGSLRKRLPATCPPPVVLDWYRDLGGVRLTLGSDAHRAQDVGADMDTALHLAHAAGFTHITLYEQRQPQQVPIAVLVSE
jgi:histidinol-phosphatase (PHP family)